MYFQFYHTHKNVILAFISPLLAGMLGAALLLLFFHLIAPVKPIVTVDVNYVIRHFIQTQSQQRLSKSHLQQRTQRFSQTLAYALQQFTHDRHVILLPKEAVIAGAQDVTPEVQRLIPND